MMFLQTIIKELKLLSHDLHGLAVLFIMPVVFMFIMSVALSRSAKPYDNLQIALIGSKQAVNTQLIKQLTSQNIHIQWLPEDSLNTAKTALQNHQYSLLIINPNTAYDSPIANLDNDKPLTLLTRADINPAQLVVTEGILRQYYSQVRLDHFLKTQQNQPNKGLESAPLPANIRSIVSKKMHEAQKNTFNRISNYLKSPLWHTQIISQSSKAIPRPNSVQHSVPAWLIFGMFFIMIPLSNVMAIEQQTNTITRLRIAHTSAGILLLSKFVPYFLINQLQFIGMLLLGRFVLPLFHIEPLYLYGSWISYATLSIAVSICALGYAFMISVLAKSTEHAVVLGGGGVIIMSALGGVMVPLYIMPKTMQYIANLSPMSWGLKAFQGLLLNHDHLWQQRYPILLLLACGTISLIIASIIYRKQLHTQVRF